MRLAATTALVTLLAAVAVHGGAAQQPSQQASKPNLLLLFPDQWRFDWDSFHTDNGKPIPLSLPTLRSVAAKATRFEHAFVPAPLCAPSRACLASGREYDHADMPNNFNNDYNTSIPTFYSLLRDHGGYYTTVTGKDDLTKKTGPGWNGTFHQSALGFSAGRRCAGKEDVVSTYPVPHEPYGLFLSTHTVPLESGKTVSAWKAHVACLAPNKVRDSSKYCDRTSFPDAFYEDNWVANNTLALLHAMPADKPWFLQVNFPGPHSPFLTTASMADTVVNRTWPPPVDFTSYPSCPKAGHNNEPSDGGRCNYAAEIENLDRLFGTVLDFLKESDQLDNTIVAISSDHGEMLGDHDDNGKTLPWQGSASVPLLVFGPGIVQGQTYDTPVATLDLAGTFLDYAGVAKAAGMTTTSLRPMLESRAHPTGVRPFVSSGLQSAPFSADADADALGKSSYSWRMVVQNNGTHNLKFVCCKGRCPGAPSTAPGPAGNGYTQLLYDIDADPYDMHDLYPSNKDTAASMRLLLPASFGCPTPKA